MLTPEIPDEVTVVEEPTKYRQVSDMSDRELLEELVYGLRNLETALEGLSENPMIAALASGQNPLMAMMGR